MRQFTKDNADLILGSLGVLMGVVLVCGLVWGALLIVRNMDKTFGDPVQTSPRLKFEIDKAKQLDFRGLSG